MKAYLILLSFHAFTFVGCEDGLTYSCDDVVAYEKFSPDQSVKLTLWERDCGATASVSSILQISSNEFDGKLDINSDRTILIIEGKKDDVSTNWSEENVIEVSLKVDKEDVYKSLEEVSFGDETYKIRYNYY